MYDYEIDGVEPHEIPDMYDTYITKRVLLKHGEVTKDIKFPMFPATILDSYPKWQSEENYHHPKEIESVIKLNLALEDGMASRDHDFSKLIF